MALDSGDEWLEELLAREPPQKRARIISDDDVEAALFLDELLHCYSSATSWVQPAVPGALPGRPAVPGVLPAQLDARPAVPAASTTGTFLCFASTTGALPAVAPKLAARLARPARPAVPAGAVVPKRPAVPARPAVRARPEVQAAVQVKFNLPKSRNAGNVLDHATQLVQDIVGQGPTIFKIGITADPAHRWGNANYGYQHDRDAYQQMLVFSEADSAGAAMLEASLINMFKNTSGCRNTAPGGEGVRHGCTTFTYIVFRHLDTTSVQRVDMCHSRMGA